MRIRPFFAFALTALFALPSAAADLSTEPPGDSYVQIPKTLMLPDFPTSMGTIYVVKDTLPVGPYLAYDHSGKLVATLYMLSMKDMDAHKAYGNLATSGAQVDHVELFFNAGHPDMEIPHYHFVLWHVSHAEEAALREKAHVDMK